MEKITATEFLKVNRFHSIVENNNTDIFNITPNYITPLRNSLEAKYSSSTVQSILFCQSIDIRASITSIADFIYPDTVLDGVTPSIQANMDLLKALWSQERREINCYQKRETTDPWTFRGAVALPNRVRSGAYYFEQLLSVIKPDGSYETQADEALGIGLVNNSFGLLSGLDEILVSANWEVLHIFYN